ncbi:nucleotidyltransferase family protein [Candidatus Pacearchaeota archaeon]|nr:nucleotidyltransferase family protein [Candidatus Pacearchaeota archaeon]
MKKDSVIEDIKRAIKPVLKRHNVIKAGIFGSYARGEQNKNSDIDILVKLNDKAGLIEIIRLKMSLQKATKKKIDLVEYEIIRSEIKDNILRDEIVILK